MEIFNKMINSTKSIAKKSGNMVESVKLKADLDALDNEIKRRKTELGAVIYRLFIEEKLQIPEIESICLDITRCNKEIEMINAQIESLKISSNNCPECAATNPPDAQFCADCGNKLNITSSYSESKVLCEKCSFKNDYSAKFCAKCGKKLINTN
ncbi:zinc ribbon domain-containing protein [Sporomusa aerivorans]|uniref:zinc ribbon domain-containing protein n=1 Tax=Sporomusa aerivorans TaxID=204936 RepID=UPI00352B5EC9